MVMAKAKLVYTDKAGNKLYCRYIKTRDAWQWSGKNREGRVIMAAHVRILMQRALREKASLWKREGKHEMVEHLRNLAKKLPKVEPKHPKTAKGKMIIRRY